MRLVGVGELPPHGPQTSATTASQIESAAVAATFLGMSCIDSIAGCVYTGLMHGLTHRIATLALMAALMAAPSAAPSVAQGPRLAGCEVFPPDNIWNVRVDVLPLDGRSAAFVTTIGRDAILHPDFGAGDYPPGSGSPIGIPWVAVPASQPRVPVSFLYADESDPGPYPIPPDAPIEGGPDGDGDRHVLVVDRDSCRLYELFYAFPEAGGWSAGSGAVFDLGSHALRPATWTSADAAGLPMLPGLVRYEEVASGEIRHALRFTAPRDPPRLRVAGAAFRLEPHRQPVIRRWGSASACGPTSTSRASRPGTGSSSPPSNATA